VITIAVGGGAETDIRPRLAEAIAARGWRLYEMAPRAISLEDLFVRILEDAETKKA